MARRKVTAHDNGAAEFKRRCAEARVLRQVKAKAKSDRRKDRKRILRTPGI